MRAAQTSTAPHIFQSAYPLPYNSHFASCRPPSLTLTSSFCDSHTNTQAAVQSHISALSGNSTLNAGKKSVLGQMQICVSPKIEERHDVFGEKRCFSDGMEWKLSSKVEITVIICREGRLCGTALHGGLLRPDE